MIGAGAVVKEDVLDYAVVVGVPAVQKGWACKCGVPLKIGKNRQGVCTNCRSRYQVKDRQLAVIEETL